jgi:hypothetical protein
MPAGKSLMTTDFMIPTSSRRAAHGYRSFSMLAMLFAISTCVGTWGCSDDAPQEPFQEPFFDVAEVTSSWPKVRVCRLSIEHDAADIIVYASPEAETAYIEGIYPFPAGTVLVKAEYDNSACTELVQLTAMRKLAPGTASEAGDWEWQRVDSNGTVLESGSLMRCVSCHQGCTNGRDFACTDP